MNSHQIRFDEDLVRRYDRSGPRYTSYPTAVQFSDRFGVNEYRAVAVASNQDPIPRPLSLYVHIPFCSSPCFYCGCTKVITRNHEKAEAYLYRLHREIEMQGDLYDRDRVVEQLHFGGGTPTFLTSLEIERLVEKMGQHFQLSCGRRPRVFDRARPAHDHDRHAARSLSHRLQSLQPRHPGLRPGRAGSGEPRPVRTRHAAADPRSARVRLQLRQRRPDLRPAEAVGRRAFAKTLDTVLSARPNRFAVYAYAHLPQMFKPQKQIKVEDLATPETRLQLLELTIDKLSAAGYIYIGMDHFALPDDELVLAQESGTMYRNFQGYSTRGYCDLVGLGVSSIGKVGDHYIQNLKTLPEYYGAIDRGELPVHRGYTMTGDDVIRRDVIQQIMCYGVLDYDSDREAPRHRLPPVLRERTRRARTDGGGRPRGVCGAGPARAAGRPTAAASSRDGLRRLPAVRAGVGPAVQPEAI